MKESVVGIDLGFGWTKAGHNGQFFRCPSVVGEAVNLFESPTGIENNIQLWYNDQHYFVGELAIRQATIKYFSMAANKARSDISAILAATALAALKPGRVNIVTGLPVDFYFQYKDDLDNQLQHLPNRVRIQMDNKTYNCALEVQQTKIVPQPLGSAMSLILDSRGNTIDHRLASKNILVVDVGFHTLDILALSALEIIRPFSFTRPLGMAVAYKGISQDLGGLPLYDVDRLFIKNQLQNHTAAFQSLARQITEEIAGLNQKFDHYLITGGGGAQLYNWLLPGFERILVPDAQQANVVGYQKLGAKTWSKRNIS
ncbi:ParM/StbA family protein [Dethiobacter alkaliphilus]|uniref:Actin-like protein N-terminal domain-containing protein n=1 Tax=Dethiobacter alkaliphilus AHT 1 TaxID=555088 RepID=C0GDB2_DETAL|nr:ParM/StbA family protein [Dethiobacter alkaliphilus]EEG78633.1 hypothetical protein DealDRAFT_0563 [Dethiobacter alkaliphilus AHT 1]MCW3489724.1 ParM/StbA family protein [Dethiobacter alkaliphilus]